MGHTAREAIEFMLKHNDGSKTFKACFESPADPLFTREFPWGYSFEAGQTVAHTDFGCGVIRTISLNENPEDDVLLDILVDWNDELLFDADHDFLERDAVHMPIYGCPECTDYNTTEFNPDKCGCWCDDGSIAYQEALKA